MPTTNGLPGSSSHFISLADAITMTTDYRANREDILESSMKGQDILPLSETFHRDAIDSLLAQSGAAGLRIYYGMDENEKVHAVLVAVNEDNADILPGSALTEDDPIIVEIGQRCPPTCPPPSDLNN